jgi:hypothetical protein
LPRQGEPAEETADPYAAVETEVATTLDPGAVLDTLAPLKTGLPREPGLIALLPGSRRNQSWRICPQRGSKRSDGFNESFDVRNLRYR